jgi:predicted dehydrogenase
MTLPRLAHVGCGYWGKNLARNFANLGVLDAVVDEHFETATAVATATGSRVACFEDVLLDNQINAVSFATPADTHYRLAMRALKAGKHVFVEKPLALKPSEALELIETARHLDRRLMVGHLLQYHPVFRKMRSIIASGAIGELTYVYSNRLSLGKLRAEENVLWSFAPHDVSMVLALAGAQPVSVTAQGASLITSGVEDWCTVQMKFADGLKAHIQASWLHPFKEQRLVAIGTDGMMVFEDSAPNWEDKLKLFRHGIDTNGPAPIASAAEAELIFVEKSEPLRNECLHFLECVVASRNALTDGEEGLAVLNVLHRASSCLAE